MRQIWLTKKREKRPAFGSLQLVVSDYKRASFWPRVPEGLRDGFGTRKRTHSSRLGLNFGTWVMSLHDFGAPTKSKCWSVSALDASLLAPAAPATARAKSIFQMSYFLHAKNTNFDIFCIFATFSFLCKPRPLVKELRTQLMYFLPSILFRNQMWLWITILLWGQISRSGLTNNH